MKDIGKNIKAIRIAKSMTQDVLAEKLYVTRQTISNYENGRSRPDIDTVIKLAQVLETETNAILYGLPQTKNRIEKLKSLWISVTIFLVLGFLYILLNHIFRDSSRYYEFVLPRNLINLTLRPAVMFLLGWVTFSIIRLFCNWQFFNSQLTKIVRCILWAVLGIIIIFPIPYIVYTVIGVIHTTLYTSTSLSMDYIPVYQEIAFLIIRITIKQPFIYSLLGSLLRIFTPEASDRHQKCKTI